MGISNDAACSTPGVCTDLSCGLADIGSRMCTCTTVWDCTSCAFPSGPDAPSIVNPPDTLMECAATIEDGVACSTTGAVQGDICQSANDATEVCACWPDDEAMLIWDCDDPPWD
jgi:hypothetical protein